MTDNLPGITGRYRGSGHPGAPVDRRPSAVDRIPEDRRKEGLKLKITGPMWNVAWELTRRLPEPAAYGLAWLVGTLAWVVGRDARKRITRNLARVVGEHELGAAVRGAFRSYARYWVEAFRAADIDPDDLDARATTAGFEHLDAVLEEGKGAIILLAHQGSWDMAAAWAEPHGYHLAVVAEIVRPRRLFEKFVRLREGVGLEVVPLKRGEKLSDRLAEVLADNHMVGLLSDRDLTGRGPIVDFCGEPCRIPPGPVNLSRRTGAPILPATMLQRPGRRWHIEMLPPVTVPEGSMEEGGRVIAEALEALIRTDPAQWHAFSPVWIADRPPHRPQPPARDVGTS